MLDGNTSYISEDLDTGGFRYSVSFELFPFSETREYSLYHGQLNGHHVVKGDKHGRYCVVRAMTDIHPNLRHWEPYMECSKQARFLANEFHKLIVKRDTTISFSNPLRVQMDTVWDSKSAIGRLLLLWKPHRKRFVEGEVVVLEENFTRSTTFINKEGFVCPAECDVLQAYGHFSWFFTGGKIVVCDLKGVRKHGGYFLSDPTVHSITQGIGDGCTTVRKYGHNDKGLSGISSFFKYHRCNVMCCNLPLPTRCPSVMAPPYYVTPPCVF